MSIEVLVIEDEPLGVVFIKRALEKAFKQPSVTTAGTVKQAVQHLSMTPYDLITFDMNLPDGTGHDIYDEIVNSDDSIMQMNAKASRVVITGYAERDWCRFNRELTNAEYFISLGFRSFWDKARVADPAFIQHLQDIMGAGR